MSTNISPYRKGCSRFPHDPERQMPGELRTYFMDDAELEELNKKYPPKPRKLTGGEKSAMIANNMYRQRQKQVEKMKGEKEKMKIAVNNKEPKITREQLLEECKKHGTNWSAAKEIAKNYDLTHTTIYNYMGKWGIREELQPAGKPKTCRENKGPTLAADGLVKEEPAVKEVVDADQAERAAEKELYTEEFQLRRAGTFDKKSAASLMRNLADMLHGEQDGDYRILLEISRG